MNIEVFTHLVDSQIDASIRDDAQYVRYVAFIKRPHSLLPQDLLSAVQHARVLPGLAQGQTRLQHLHRDRQIPYSENQILQRLRAVAVLFLAEFLKIPQHCVLAQAER